MAHTIFSAISTGRAQSDQMTCTEHAAQTRSGCTQAVAGLEPKTSPVATGYGHPGQDPHAPTVGEIEVNSLPAPRPAGLRCPAWSGASRPAAQPSWEAAEQGGQAMKKLINTIEDVVTETLEGVAVSHPDKVRKLPDWQVLVRADGPVAGKVALISGGGSGHEPAFWGGIGPGLIDGAVQGEVFTPPTPDQILACLRAVDAGAGVIQIYNNYTGDVTNFDLAQERAREAGLRVDTLLIADDVSVEDGPTSVGRRGIAGNFLVQKVVGAAAAQGRDFDDVLAVGRKAISGLRSMGMALSPCTVPAAGEPTFTIGEGEMELGMGLHGEPGVSRRPLEPADAVAEALTTRPADDLPLRDGDRAILLVNGLGATPPMELYIIARRAHAVLAGRGVSVHRTYVMQAATSMDMAGCSVSLLRVDEELAGLVNAPADAVAFTQV
jgi:phosphoenolpyruvate---glycerone phosphotransferase subunit DhaK